MRFGHYQAGARRLVASASLGAWLLCGIVYAPLTYAVGTTINANVCGHTVGTIHISSPADGSTVTTASPTITGTVSHLAQIRAYVNGTFHMTVPLDTASTTFSYTSNLTAGENTVKLVGIDPCNATSPEAVIGLTYDVDAPSSPVAQVVDTATSGATGVAEYMTEQVQQAAQTQPAAGLSGVAYSVMQALDLAPVAGSTESMERMTQRFTGVVAGASLVLFAHPLFVGYHLIRYQLMQWNLPALPAPVRRHALMVLRLVGGALFLGAFFI